MSQLVMPDPSSTAMFECPLCTGLSRQPKIAMCCQKVFCGQCFDRWLRNSNSCPSCQAAVVLRDGSTGGCTESSVRKLDRTSTGVQAVLWRVYGSIRIRCTHEQCSWTGNIFKYPDHLAACAFEAGASTFQLPQRQQAAPLAPEAVGASVSPTGLVAASTAASTACPVAPAVATDAATACICGGGAKVAEEQAIAYRAAEEMISEDTETSYDVVQAFTPSGPNQLSLVIGDRVSQTQATPHGWSYGVRLTPGQGPSEGWFPSVSIREIQQEPPRPVQAPPPSSPPAGSTQVSRDYTAADPSQLTVKEGELVHIKNRDPSGWTLISRAQPTTVPGVKREGWVPDWLLRPETM